jgi:hypothetical protein
MSYPETYQRIAIRLGTASTTATLQTILISSIADIDTIEWSALDILIYQVIEDLFMGHVIAFLLNVER